MAAEHWLNGFNVPPYLEALPAPQPVATVQWDHSPAVAPLAVLSTTKLQSEQAGPIPSPVASLPSVSAREAPLDQRKGEESASAITPREHISKEEIIAPSTSPNNGADGEVVRKDLCEGGMGDEKASPPLEKKASLGKNWRGGGSKIKVGNEQQHQC